MIKHTKLTPKARVQIESIAAEYHVSAEELVACVRRDVASLFNATALSRTDWFKAQPEHCVHAARLRRGDGQVVLNLHMVVDQEGNIYSNEEKTLSDDYFAFRIVEETRVDLKLGILT